jgi:F-type H+-transporting ATPase subunit gamma
MESLKEITQRMKQVEDTEKLTHAMYLITSNELKKAREQVDRTEPFFEALKVEIKRIFRTVEDVESPYFYPPNMEDFVNGSYGIFAIAANRGLAGSYDMDVIRATEAILKHHSDARLYVLGDRGRRVFRSRGHQIEEDFVFSQRVPDLDLARAISLYLLDEYNTGRIKKLFMVYSSVNKGRKTQVVSTRLLPFHRGYFDEEKSKTEEPVKNPFNFEPSVEEVLNHVLTSYIQGLVYGGLVESYFGEEEARMMAMDQASNNAKDILAGLEHERNHLRQEQITAEISQVAAAAKAYRQEIAKRKE